MRSRALLLLLAGVVCTATAACGAHHAPPSAGDAISDELAARRLIAERYAAGDYLGTLRWVNETSGVTP